MEKTVEISDDKVHITKTVSSVESFNLDELIAKQELIQFAKDSANSEYDAQLVEINALIEQAKGAGLTAKPLEEQPYEIS